MCNGWSDLLCPAMLVDVLARGALCCLCMHFRPHRLCIYATCLHEDHVFLCRSQISCHHPVVMLLCTPKHSVHQHLVSISTVESTAIWKVSRAKSTPVRAGVLIYEFNVQIASLLWAASLPATGEQGAKCKHSSLLLYACKHIGSFDPHKLHFCQRAQKWITAVNFGIARGPDIFNVNM